MNIQPIVEGHGEMEAIPVLLRRLRNEAEVYDLDVNRPIRKKRSELVNEVQLRETVRLAMKQEDCAAILILFDSDDDCPREKGPEVQAWARDEAHDTPCAVVLAHREYEAWFLAAVESLRGHRGIREDAVSHPTPEAPRGAKKQLQDRMIAGRRYNETLDQPALSAVFDLTAAHSRCRSFRRLVNAFGQLATAVGAGLPTPWPPSEWVAEQEDA
jgi:hypothetical protein